MPSTFMISTARSSLNAVRFQGILVTESYSQIQSTVRKVLSVEHALFFAEPSHAASGDSTDWYTEAEGVATPLADLPLQAQGEARQRIGKLASDINALAESLLAEKDPAKQIRGNMLRLALLYPNEDSLYVVGTQPVIVNWGFEPASSSAAPESLIRMGGALAVVAPAPAEPIHPTVVTPYIAPEVRPFSWLRILGWLLAGFLCCLLLLFLASLLFGSTPGCSPFFLNRTQHTVAPDIQKRLAEERAEQESLMAELESLRTSLSQKSGLCVRSAPQEAPQASLPAAPALPTPSPSLNAELKPEPPAPGPTPEPPAKKPLPGSDLVIPKGAEKNNDLSFLEGCWTAGSLSNARTDEQLTVTYCFSKNGKGERTITGARSKTKCKGPLTSTFTAQGKLRITEQTAVCPRGNDFFGYLTECTPMPDGKAECFGINPEDRSNTWKSEFRRR